MSFEGKIVWITGASSGIGEALALTLHRAGARLVLSSRRQAELERVQRACGGDRAARAVALDLTDAASLPRKAEEAQAAFGPVDVFINSGGISQRSLVKDTGVDVHRRLMEVNFFGPVALAVALLPSMLERRSGQLVMVSSLAGKFGTPMRSGYAAAKHALHGFFDSLRAEVRGTGVSVTLVCPGYIRTEITLRSLTGDGSEYGKVDAALAHGMPAAECARIVARGIARNEEEILVGGKETYAVLAHRLFPRLFARAVSRATIK
jgi:dehydrogenase/reductase SDR family member 7B